MLLVLLYFETIDRFVKILKTKYLPFSSGSSKVQRKILEKARYAKHYCKIILFLECMALLTIFPVFGDEDSFIPLYIITKKYFVNAFIPAVLCIIPVATLTMYSTNFAIYIVLYAELQQVFQLQLLQNFVIYHIENLSPRIVDAAAIYRKLKKCADVYANIQKLVNVCFFLVRILTSGRNGSWRTKSCLSVYTYYRQLTVILLGGLIYDK